MSRLLCVLAVCGMMAGWARAGGPEESAMEWWRGARFGMFIHWGLYAQLAGEYRGKPVPHIGEWIMHYGQIPVEEYEKLAGTFNPVKFDARAWVKIAKSAGISYIVITTKHHDGFALFDSGVSGYDVMNTPFGRDIMKELAEACREEGIRICWYHSIMDWHHPDYLPRRGWETRPAEGADFGRYREYLKGQVGELLTKYGPIGVMWFDGEWEETWTHEMGADLYEYCKKLQPGVLVNNRVDKGRQGMAGMTKEGGFRGDFGTPEQEIPARGLPGTDWETCQTMNETWGFKKDDDSWKTSRTLIRQLIETASKGGNFLLNVGPTAEGEIPGPSVKRLADIGKWMATNAEAIRGTHASPFQELHWGRCTSKPGTLYLHVFEWPKDKVLRVPGLRNTVTRAYLLADAEKALETKRAAGDVLVSLPDRMPDRDATVVVLKIEGAPDVDQSSAFEAPAPDGTITLEARDAAVSAGVELERVEGWEYLGLWHGQGGAAVWRFDVKEPGTYRVAIDVGCAPGAEGNGFVVECAGRTLRGLVPPTRAWRDFQWMYAGTVEIGKAGAAELVVKPAPGLKGALMNIRRVRVMPAD